MKIKPNLLKYISGTEMKIKEFFVSPTLVFSRLAVQIMRIIIFYTVYSFAYKSIGANEINGVSMTSAVWSLAVIQLIHNSRRTAIYQELLNEIQTGQIETKLYKPYNYILHLLFNHLGECFVRVVLFSTTTIIAMLILAGVPSLSPLQILFVVITGLIGVLLGQLQEIILALPAFWIEKPEPFRWIAEKISWIFNGNFVPIDILPPIFSFISLIYPFSPQFYAAQLFNKFTLYRGLMLLLIQVLWLVLFILFIKYIYRKGVRSVSINGG